MFKLHFQSYSCDNDGDANTDYLDLDSDNANGIADIATAATTINGCRRR